MINKKRTLELLELVEAELEEDGGVPVELSEDWRELKSLILNELINTKELK